MSFPRSLVGRERKALFVLNCFQENAIASKLFLLEFIFIFVSVVQMMNKRLCWRNKFYICLFCFWHLPKLLQNLHIQEKKYFLCLKLSLWIYNPFKSCDACLGVKKSCDGCLRLTITNYAEQLRCRNSEISMHIKITCQKDVGK